MQSSRVGSTSPLSVRSALARDELKDITWTTTDHWMLFGYVLLAMLTIIQ
jgi:hypothetical protein